MILITGGAGFIGSNLAKYLDDIGYDVVCVDNFFLGLHTNLPTQLRGSCIQVDISKTILPLLDLDITDIVHLAAYSSAPMFDEYPQVGFDNNVNGFQNMIKLAFKKRARLLYASTSSLYSQCKVPFKESSVVTPSSYYELTKYINEREAYLHKEVASLGLRFFSVYGKNEIHKGQYANLVSQFMWKMKEGIRPTIYGDGLQARDFIYVGDVCKIIRLLTDNPWHYPILNVGTSEITNLRKLFFMIRCHLRDKGYSVPDSPEYIRNPIANYVKFTRSDNTLLHKEIGSINFTTLKEGIQLL